MIIMSQSKAPRSGKITRGFHQQPYEKDIDMPNLSYIPQVVSFHGTELFIVEHEGQPYTPMKPIVEAMGLDWKSQFVKLKDRFSATMVEITTVANDGKCRLMTCLPVRKLAAWLYSIHANKVKPQLRATVKMYQDECDDVLWDYWIKGQATNPRPKTHKSERTPLHDAHALLVAKTKHLNSSDAWKIINQRFGTNHIDEIPYDMIPVAVEYVHHLIALMSNKNGNTGLDTNVRAMAIYLAWLSGWWRQFGPAVRGINPHMAAAIHDYFNDGGFVAWSFIEKEKRTELHKRIDTHPWHLPPMDRYHLLNRN